ncbi:MAG: hypothetical protein KDC54_11005 [Lewinella sp.]|nr:hypothetical protein [Lewinella sp.]
MITIRDILMGEVIEEFNGRFEKMEKRLASQEAALKDKEAQLNERLDALNQLVGQHADQLRNALENTSRNDRHRLGELLSNMGAELLSDRET